MKPLNPVVAAIGEIQFVGNIVPHSWYSTPLLKYDNGKPNMVAITLLSDIIYWYRPSVIIDEHTGRIIEVKQKFRAHRLHKDYEVWGQKYGFSRRQVQDGVAFLVQNELITREIACTDGFNNRVFMEPNADLIRKISMPEVEEPNDTTEDALRYNVTPPRQNVTPPPAERMASYLQT